MGWRERDLAKLGAGARRQIALEQMERARAEALKLQAPGKRIAKPAAKSKFGNKPVTLDGMRFASQAEGRYYLRLRERQARGEISGLVCHPVFPLEIGGIRICRYIADFRFTDGAGRVRVQDVKGGRATITPVFRLKRRMMRAILGIEVEVISA